MYVNELGSTEVYGRQVININNFRAFKSLYILMYFPNGFNMGILFWF